MKAVICTGYCPPEVLKIQEVSKPFPKDNELLVRIYASAINSGDVRVRGLEVKGFMKVILRLVLGFSKPRKPILGTVYSGIVESVGEKVSRFKSEEPNPLVTKVWGLKNNETGIALYVNKETANRR